MGGTMSGQGLGHILRTSAILVAKEKAFASVLLFLNSCCCILLYNKIIMKTTYLLLFNKINIFQARTSLRQVRDGG